MNPGDNPSSSIAPAPSRRFREWRDGRLLAVEELPLQQAARDGRLIERSELTLQFDDGEVRHIFGGASPLYDEHGRVRGAVAVFVDITEQKLAMEQLAQREREMRTLADNTPDVLVRFDRAHRHVFVNTAVLRASGKAPAEILGRTNQELGMPAHLVQRWDDALNHVFTTGSRIEISFEFDSPDRRRFFTSRLVPEFDADHRVQYVLAVVEDITERRNAEQALRDAERRKDEFLATLSHELRNPLAPLRTGLALLSAAPAAPRAAEVRRIMQRQLDQLVRLVDDLLDVSRISAGKMTLKYEVVSLQSVVSLALETTHPLLEASRHEVRVAMPPEPVWVLADTMRLAQVLANLLSNASKYTPDGGRIDVDVTAAAEQAQLTVRDSGVGIPPDMLQDVFELFAQVDSTLHRSQGGLGIGLALARSILTLHGGRLEAHSDGLGHGSRFTCHLPMANAPASKTEVGSRPGALLTRPRARVLVADDNADAAETLAMLLTEWGCELRMATDGVQAVDLCLGWKPQVAFVDIGMPRLDGYGVARQLRAAGCASQLIALTGWGSQAEQQRSYEAGFDHHLVKPVHVGVLEEVLAACLQKAGVNTP